jgi:hypothetical protein
MHLVDVNEARLPHSIISDAVLPVFAWQLFAERAGATNSCRVVRRQMRRLFGFYLFSVAFTPAMRGLSWYMPRSATPTGLPLIGAARPGAAA